MRRTLAAVAVAYASMSPLAAGGTAYADHCPPALPDPVERVCNNVGNPTRMECWSYPDGSIACRIPD